MSDNVQNNVLTVHYRRLLGDYEHWTLWVWNAETGGFSTEISPSRTDDFGLLFEIDLDKPKLQNKRVGLLPKYKNWKLKDAPDRFYDHSMPAEVYLLEHDEIVYGVKPPLQPVLKSAFLDSKHKIRLVFDRQIKKDFLSQYPITPKTENTAIEIKHIAFSHGSYGKAVYLSIEKLQISDFSALNAGKWSAEIKNIGRKEIYLGDLVYDKYFHTNKELGVSFHDNLKIFRVFAPFACEVTLLLKSSLKSDDLKEFNLRYIRNGTWQINLSEDIEGFHYRYRVKQKGTVTEGIDPYAKAVTAHNGWAIIARDNTPVADSPQFKFSQSIIYELHLRDFTIDPESGVKFKGKYLGLTEENTHHTDFKGMKTGLDHLKELGINTVQIMPISDFENDETSDNYRWGYMPVNFNSPDGWYATETSTSVRISELKKLISTLHKNGIKVVLDVVYNHTAENNSNHIYNFNAVALDYYYRRRPDETYYDGSGCGNEFKSESRMGRKFIIDSLKMWAKEYKVDGFRFDLMGLTDLQTIETAVKELKSINPALIFYGEPWTAGHTPLTHTIHKGSQKHKGFAVFNDNFRDGIKGSTFDLGHGYVQAGLNYAKVKKGIMGSIDDFCSSPLETINYASCHDGHTLFDRIVLSTKELSLEERIKMTILSNAIILTSQGIPFIHSGEEFLRTKKGEHNSYNKPDEINAIYWRRKNRFKSVFDYYKGLIELRKLHLGFRMKNARAIHHNLKFYANLGLHLEAPSIGYVLSSSNVGDDWAKIVVLINPTRHKKFFPLPGGEFLVAVKDKMVSSDKPLAVASHRVLVPSISLMVLYR
jgi:pullulanase